MMQIGNIIVVTRENVYNMITSNLFKLLPAFQNPWAHLGVNDISDVANDQVKEMKTISILYGMKGTAYWILFFSVIHFGAALLFLSVLGTFAIAGFAVALLLISIGNYIILKGKSADAGMKALPLFHVAMLIYAITIILEYVI